MIKLGDCVLSKQCNAGDFDYGSMCDALLYQAPEVLKDGAELKSDVWSLGMSMIEMVGGRNPYVGMTTKEFKNELLNKRPPSFSSSGWSDDLVDFVKRCLVKDVNERASVDDLLKVSAVVMGED